MDDPMKAVTAVPPESPAPRIPEQGIRELPGDRPQATQEGIATSLQGLKERHAFGDRVAEFAYNEDLGRVVITIYSSDSEPREIVRQIPPEDYLAFAARYRELLGVLFDHQA